MRTPSIKQRLLDAENLNRELSKVIDEYKKENEQLGKSRDSYRGENYNLKDEVRKLQSTIDDIRHSLSRAERDAAGMHQAAMSWRAAFYAVAGKEDPALQRGTMTAMSGPDDYNR